jgi:hypothetical protein
MKMHTDEQCKIKLEGIKVLSERLLLSIKDRGSEYAIAESIIVMCNELIREFPNDQKD